MAFCGQRDVRVAVLALARGRSSLHGPPRDHRAPPPVAQTLSELCVRAGRYSHPHRDAGKDVRRVCCARARRCDRQNAPPSVHWIPGGRGWSDQAAARDLQSACDGTGAIAEWSRRYQTARRRGALVLIECATAEATIMNVQREGGVTMASMQLKLMNELYASIKARVSKPGLDLATNRDIVENLHLAAIEPEAVTYAEVNADGVPALWCIPEGSDPARVLLHSHSGGSVVTSMHTDRKAIGHIAKAVGVRALVLNFRRAPEHKFPAQIDDVEKAYHWLLTQKIRPENIASIGHSIGGNLAVSLALTLRDKGVPLPAAILSVSPWYDMEMMNETWESNAATDALLTRQAVELFREAWIGGTGVARNDPPGNMLYADLTGLPPIMVYYGAHEVLVGDAIEFAKRAKGAGVDVTLRSLPEGQHNFILGAGRVPEVDRAIAEIGRWLRSKLGLPVLAMA